jgi:hypothetical protein
VPATVAAASAAQIATIANAKPTGQAHGGASFIPEESTYLLSQGERVLAPRQNQDLTEFLKGGGSRPIIVLQIEGRKPGETLHDMRKDGRLRIDGRSIQ